MLVACSSLMKIMALVWVGELSKVHSKAGSSEGCGERQFGAPWWALTLGCEDVPVGRCS